jgi:hypothetical protein
MRPAKTVNNKTAIYRLISLHNFHSGDSDYIKFAKYTSALSSKGCITQHQGEVVSMLMHHNL